MGPVVVGLPPSGSTRAVGATVVAVGVSTGQTFMAIVMYRRVALARGKRLYPRSQGSRSPGENWLIVTLDRG